MVIQSVYKFKLLTSYWVSRRFFKLENRLKTTGSLAVLLVAFTINFTSTDLKISYLKNKNEYLKTNFL